MHTVELLDEALQLAAAQGLKIRQEWLGGGGGVCEIKGQRWVFVDLSLTAAEQLQQVLEGIQLLAIPSQIAFSPQLRQLLAPRRAA